MLEKYKNKGFTLIELLVVVAIIGVLTAVLLVNLVGIRERGADTKKKSDLNQLKTAMRLYYNDFQSYPPSSGSKVLACSGAVCSEGNEMNNNAGEVYFKSFPEYTAYFVDADGEAFYIGVTLKNDSDPDAEDSATKCGAPALPVGVFYVCID